MTAGILGRLASNHSLREREREWFERNQTAGEDTRAVTVSEESLSVQ